MADPNQQQANQPAFALVPGNIPGVIDFSTRQGLAIWSAAVRPLYEDPADFFNVESSGLQTFLALLRLRATTSGWDFDVPQDVADPLNNLLDITTNHGRLTLDHIRTFCTTYVNTQTRAAQENIQVVRCILSSLTLPGFRKVQTWHTDWHIGEMPCAFMLLKVLIRESYIDTQATTRILREHLSSLPERLGELNGDIDQFNAFVKVTMDQLAARGETTQDLLANLFKGYLSSHDATFRKYMEKKQEEYDEGVAFTADGLMTSASNKYKILVQSGKWMALSEEQSKIIALETKLNKMGNSGSKSTSSGGKSTNAPKKSNSGNSKSSSSNKKKGKKDTPAWMTQWPGRAAVDSNQPKVKDGKTYYWCKNHKKYCMHKTSECCLNSPSSGGNQPAGPSTSSTQGAPNSAPPSVRVSTATMMDE